MPGCKTYPHSLTLEIVRKSDQAGIFVDYAREVTPAPDTISPFSTVLIPKTTGQIEHGKRGGETILLQLRDKPGLSIV